MLSVEEIFSGDTSWDEFKELINKRLCELGDQAKSIHFLKGASSGKESCYIVKKLTNSERQEANRKYL